jgi:hypothetical protein
MITNEKLDSVTMMAKMFLRDNPEQKRHYDVTDLTNETVLVLLEGYRGNKIEGDTKFAVMHAAERLSRVECQEMTGHDFVSNEGSSPSGRRNTEDDFVQQAEVNDWLNTKLNGEQATIVKLLIRGETQAEIAGYLGVSSSSISVKLKEIQELAKEDFDVN